MAQLRPITKDLWVIDHPLQVGGLHLGTRTTVVRLSNGGLWLHSPGPLSPELMNEIAALGSVQAIVAPNAMHHLYLAENIRAFPQCSRVCFSGPPGENQRATFVRGPGRRSTSVVA